jgi:Fuc2NAc and GlcNAc transferase
MIWYLLAIVFITSYLGTLIVRKFATKKHIMDIPNVRSSHDHPVARGGGLAIVFAWYLSITLLFVFKEFPEDLFFAMLCGIPISVIGFIDDIISVSSKLRFIIQVVFASLAVLLLGGITSVDLGFTVWHSSFLFNILGVIGIVWFINLFNFLDGIDGYISAEIIFICFAVLLLFGFELPLLLAAATAGFLIWNWQPAKIFMGDVGSTLLGFTIGVFAIYYQSTGQSSIIFWLMLSSLFWFDATFTLFRRWRNKEQLSQAHKNMLIRELYKRVSVIKKLLFILYLLI